MSSVKVTTLLGGAEQLSRALKLSKPKTKARVVATIHAHTSAIAAKARAAAPRVTGEMAGTIRDEYANDGLVGFVKVGYGKLPRRSKAQTIAGLASAKGRTKKVGRGAYAPVVERGDQRRNHQPHPFLDPAYQAEKPKAITDIDHALNSSVQEIANEAHP
jgi:HK97 gp10 family phage protein